MNAPLTITNLVKDYGQLCAVNNVSFDVQAGEIFGLLGPNGAGKTSIISIINTLLPPTSGKVEVFGFDVSTDPKEAKVRVGCVPQELITHGFFNVDEILHIHSGYYGLRKNQKHIEFLIDRLGLQPHRKKSVKELSSGLKRRLLIAKSLVHKPKLVLLDEPTAGVDVELRHSLWDFVFELRDQGTSFLLTTHYLEEAEQMCDRIGIINHGTLNTIGETKELIEKYTVRDVIITLKEPIETITHPRLTEQTSTTLTFKLPASHNVGELLSDLPLAIQNIHDVHIREGRLEDLFARLTRKSNDT